MEFAPPAPEAQGGRWDTRRAGGMTAEDFEAVVSRCQAQVYRVLRALVWDKDAADTLTQDCFLQAFRSRAGYRGDSSVETWLLSIAVNLARDHFRNRRWAFWRRLVRGERLGP